MSHFPTAIEHTLKWEGGYVDHPSDPGGATNFGISLRWYRQAVDPGATVSDIRFLRKDEAIELYRTHFWRPVYERFIDREVAVRVFDSHVNMGALQAGRNLQRALHACGKMHVVEDGIIGPATVSAANSVPLSVMIPAWKATTAGHYRLLVARNSQFQAFLRGWLRRVYE